MGGPQRRTRPGAALLVALALASACAPAALAAQAPAEARLSVKDMWCAKCEQTVESILERIDGVAAAEANRKAETAVVGFDPARATPREMARALNRETYYKASVMSVSRKAASDTEPANRTSGGGSGFGGGYLGLALVAVLLGAYLLVSRVRRRLA